MVKILVVDDAAFMRMMVKENLSKAGYSDFAEARNGREAVERFAEEKPDLVLLDITMPVMDGLTALREILGIDPAAKVVMCSAMGQENMVIEAVGLGALDFIVKPFKPERLVQTVGNALSNEGIMADRK
ncbi:MAG: response regulator [Clostridiales Family XIII bacterium]|nr:response regulator [Clostridiales Family XIII bacterium]